MTGGMDLTNEDVAESWRLLDSLPYDSLDVGDPALPADAAPRAGRRLDRRTPGARRAECADAGRRRPLSPGAWLAEATAPARRRDLPPGGGADGLVAVTTPLPGTFYRAPRPGAEPFVQDGNEVGPDTVVAIVETMKLMNSVHAGTAGRVAQDLRGQRRLRPARHHADADRASHVTSSRTPPASASACCCYPGGETAR